MRHECTYGELAAYIRAKPPRLGPRVRLIAVDGPSGSGKSHFAEKLATALPAPIIHTDDLLDGWADQFTFWTRLEDQVLTPLRQGRPARYRAFRWTTGAFEGPPITVDPADTVLLEGVSAARREIRAELSLAVFVTAPRAIRSARALARDGDDSLAYRAYLERWRAAEDRHFAEDRTADAADLIIDGAADSSGDRFVATRVTRRTRTGW